VNRSGPLEEILKYAATEGRNGKGITVIFAAGNGNESISDEKTYDGYASSEYTMAVGASNGDGVRASYSDFGETLDILAPSCDINVDSFYDPFVSDSVRHGIWTTDVSGEYGYTSSCYEPNFCGTSASTPIAAGVVGLILGVNPDLTREEIYETITDTADKISPEDADYNNMSGHSETYGYGRINARAAVEKACGDSCASPPPVDEEPYYPDIDFKPEEISEDKEEDVDYEESIVYKSYGRGCNLIFLKGDM
ncbi:MAG: S8 family serine peptidase, partial [bacterium]